MSKLDYYIHDEADARGSVLVPDELQQGELVVFRPSSAAIEFEAQSDAEFVLGSAARMITILCRAPTLSI